MRETFREVTSPDGTTIAFDRLGDGSPVILVCGAMCDRALMRPTAEELAKHFTVFNYDRRGRGDSSDTAPYAVEREIEDIGTLDAEAGGTASLVMGDIGRDGTIPVDKASRVRGPALVLTGGADYPWMIDVGRRLAEAMPNGRHRVLEGQEHAAPPEVLVPVLKDFFSNRVGP